MKKIYGATGSYPEYFVLSNFRKNSVVVIDNPKRKKLFFHDINVYKKYFDKSVNVLDIPSETDIFDIESQIKRNYALFNILTSDNNIVVLDKKFSELKVRNPEDFLKDTISLKIYDSVNRDKIIEKLFRNGFIREDYIENEGEFSVKGGFISIFIPFVGIVEIDMFGDTVENIFLKSKIGTRKKIESIDIFPLYDRPVSLNSKIEVKFEDVEKVSLVEYLKEFDFYYLDIYKEDKKGIYLFSTGSNQEIGKVEKDFKIINLPLRQPLVLKNKKIAFLPEEEKVYQFEFDPLEEGDYIIHEDYGIGIFRGIETRNIKGRNYDFMILEYADGEKIWVSYLHFDKIFKYKADGIIKLDKIGGTSWRNIKKKVKNSLKKVAKDLIKLYSERQKIKRKPFIVEDELIQEFEKSFPYIETPDQLKAINDVKRDMSSEKPMERIICGDVGFGKTEVALRAIFIAAVNGKQSAVLVPTTILSYQHYKNFKERLEPFGIKVENLSRLKSKKETEKILQELKEGKIDVIVGTHKLLQDNVKFKNLGLLVIDEEHRFGVRAKEKIRQLKKDIDTLYMTATPIPRTLNMALSGLKELSVIKTTPDGRVETKTFVSVENENIIKEAIKRELSRNGQVFYLHNRIETIEDKANYIKKLFKDAKVAVAHGRMKPKEIENVILDFIEKKIDILVATSIIETGIDIPTANTLIIERADLFGLAQLYHLRGRVGRGNIQAYCYLLIPPEISKDAEKRIDAILRLTRPGSGLKISIEDMQIRGAGNILGVEQSGHIKAVGYDFYLKLLQEAINEEYGKEERKTDIVINLDSFIPENFISDPSERMNIYMAVSKADNIEEIEQIKEYLKDFYSGIPETFKLYLEVEKLKRAVKGKGISKIEIDKEIGSIYFDDDTPPELIKQLIQKLQVKRIYADKLEFFTNKDVISQIASIFETQPLSFP